MFACELLFTLQRTVKLPLSEKNGATSVMVLCLLWFYL